jgi:nucleotide-binding universal stress UspA family protein
MINTIVVPTDGSEHADRAVEMAGEIAARFGARVVILHALLHHTSTTDLKAIAEQVGVADAVVNKIDELEKAMFEVAAADYGPVTIPVPPAILRQVGDRIAGKARQAIEAKGVDKVATQVVDGSPAENIIAAAEHEKADLIVMGRRGLGNIAGMLMGSVSHKVSHLANCACLTVR